MASETKVTKAELVKAVREGAGVTADVAGKAVDAVVKTIIDGITVGSDVKIQGLGTFKTVVAAERNSRNPRTGEALVAPAHNRVKFVPSLGLKNAVR